MKQPFVRANPFVSFFKKNYNKNSCVTLNLNCFFFSAQKRVCTTALCPASHLDQCLHEQICQETIKYMHVGSKKRARVKSLHACEHGQNCLSTFMNELQTMPDEWVPCWCLYSLCCVSVRGRL